MKNCEIDWNEAPEGTTHFGPEHNHMIANWFKRKGVAWLIWSGSGWDSCHDGLRTERVVTMIKRPDSKDWNGEGLPPVGTVCEFAGGTNCPEDPFDKDLKEGDEVTIIAHFKDGESSVAAFTFNPRNLSRGNACVEQGMHGCFRPIRTPEQIAAEEREKAIDQMLADAQTTPTMLTTNAVYFGALYDAGYRKQVRP